MAELGRGGMAEVWLGTDLSLTRQVAVKLLTGLMKPSTKGKGWYCPVKLPDGHWCKGK